MSRRLLYLVNGPRRTPLVPVDRWFADAGFEVETWWAYGGEFPPTLDGYAGAFLSGSPHGAYEDVPWIHQEHDLVRKLAASGIPILGVCFGSQILGSALCGRDQVFRRPSCEVAYADVALREPARTDPLTRGFGDRISMIVWHNDEVRDDHPDMTVLGSTDLCPNQIWRYRDLPVWGIQGHPEITAEYVPLWIETHRARLLSDGADLETLGARARRAGEARRLLDNFLDVCTQGGAGR